jgi:hypothetical protein
MIPWAFGAGRNATVSGVQLPAQWSSKAEVGVGGFNEEDKGLRLISQAMVSKQYE